MEVVECANRLGPPTLFTIQAVEPGDLLAGSRLLEHVGIELHACYQVRGPWSEPVMEAVTAVGAGNLTASVTAVVWSMSPRIDDYPLPDGMTVGDAVRQHWKALENR